MQSKDDPRLIMTFELVPVPPPLSADETAEDYSHRLEGLGYDEMRIRKTLLEHFMPINLNDTRIFNSQSDARVRYLTMIHHPAHTHKRLVKKLVARLGISEDDAEHSVSRFEEVGEMPFIPWTRPKN